jgi:hypothetical protein
MNQLTVAQNWSARTPSPPPQISNPAKMMFKLPPLVPQANVAPTQVPPKQQPESAHWLPAQQTAPAIPHAMQRLPLHMEPAALQTPTPPPGLSQQTEPKSPHL